MGDEVWIKVADVSRIFDDQDAEHLIVARYHGEMLADSVHVENWFDDVIKDSRSRLWKLTLIREDGLAKFIRVMAKPTMITVYEAL